MLVRRKHGKGMFLSEYQSFLDILRLLQCCDVIKKISEILQIDALIIKSALYAHMIGSTWLYHVADT